MNTLILLILLTQTKTYDNVEIIYCYDGDTCTINFHFGLGSILSKQEIRLCDINAPEINKTITREAGEKSKQALLAILNDANKLSILIPQRNNCDQRHHKVCDKKDKYGRWLAYILADGKIINNIMIDRGYATPYIKCK